MPYSDNSNTEWMRWLLEQLQPQSIIDIGAGAGKYGQLSKEILPGCHTTAVEIWAPYAIQFGLDKIYDRVDICDARIYPFQEVDLVIMGDVLEHMTKEDALALWERISKVAKNAVISIPIVHYPQDEYEGNPYEIHIEDHWTHEKVLESFAGITGFQVFPVVGCYAAKFK